MNQTIPILLYHSVRPDPAPGFEVYTTSPSEFARHLDRLLDRGFTPLTVGDLLGRSVLGTLPAKPAVITVDDGFADFADHVWPLLEQRGLSATLYVTAGVLGGAASWLGDTGTQLPMLSAAALRDLLDAGCEIGAHSMTHPQLDCLTQDAAYAEIRDSKDVLEQALQCAVDGFAYPHGYHSRVTRELVVAAGYRSATAVRNALSHDSDDRFALARVTITGDYDLPALDRVLSGHGVPTAGSRQKLRTLVWRQARRLQRPMVAGW